MTPDAVILQRYWPRVLVDKGWQHDVSDEVVGRVGRERFIESLKARRNEITDSKGHKVKLAQWVSWNKSHDEWDSEHAGNAARAGQHRQRLDPHFRGFVFRREEHCGAEPGRG